MRFLLILVLFHFGISFCSNAQIIKNGGTAMIVTPGSYGVANPITSSDSYIFQAENSIVIKPLGSTPFIVTEAGASAGEYFIARIVSSAPLSEMAYSKLSPQVDGGIYTTRDKKLSFSYLEQYAPGPLNYRIYSNPSDEKTVPAYTKTYGYNYVVLDLSQSGLEDGKLYILEVTDEKKGKSYLKFEYKNN